MHEISVMTEALKIVEAVAQENQLIKVKKVTLRVGRLRQVLPDLFYFAFDTLKSGSLLEDAQLEILFVPVEMRCVSCGETFKVEENTYICPGCCGTRLDTLKGSELMVESIEGEQEDHPEDS